MARPPQTITSSRWRSFLSLVMFQYGPIILSMLSGIVVCAAFYVVFGRLAAIITGALYVVGLFAVFACKDVVKVVCYPRYDTLSKRRQDEVDKVRARGLRRILEAVTLVSIYKLTSLHFCCIVMKFMICSHLSLSYALLRFFIA